MKLSKKFIEDLHKIGEDAFIEKNQWIGKLVPEIIIDNLQKRGISQEDIEGCVILTVEEAKHLLSIVMDSAHDHCINQEEADVFHKFVKKIEQAEGKL